MNLNVELLPLDPPETLYVESGYFAYNIESNTMFFARAPEQEIDSEYLDDELLADKSKKVLIPFYDNFSHFWVESIAPLISYARSLAETDWTAVLAMRSFPDNQPMRDMARFAMEKLENFLGIRCALVEVPEHVEYLKLANAEVFTNTKYEVGAVPLLRDFISTWEIPKDQELKSLYIPRGDRVQDEDRLISFLKEKGFEVVDPGSDLTFHEQVKLMANAKTLVSATGSQLFNLMFMPHNSTVVEITTPLSYPGDDEDYARYHLMYSIMSAAAGLTYISIPNNNSGTEFIIESLLKIKNLC